MSNFLSNREVEAGREYEVEWAGYRVRARVLRRGVGDRGYLVVVPPSGRESDLETMGDARFYPVGESEGPGELVTVGWQSVEDCLPDNARVVLATDMETHYLAIYHLGEWRSAETDEEFDSYISHWQELPELPEDGQ